MVVSIDGIERVNLNDDMPPPSYMAVVVCVPVPVHVWYPCRYPFQYCLAFAWRLVARCDSYVIVRCLLLHCCAGSAGSGDDDRLGRRAATPTYDGDCDDGGGGGGWPSSPVGPLWPSCRACTSSVYSGTKSSPGGQCKQHQNNTSWFIWGRI